MSDKPAELVSLFRCKKCKTRMFERDCKAHMDRHGVYTNGDLLSYFTRGPKDVPARPGSLYKPLHHGRSKKKQLRE